MKTRCGQWNLWAVVLVAALAMGCCTGCGMRRSLGSLSRSQEEAKLETVTEQVRLAAANRGDTLMADFLAHVPKNGGASGYTERREPLKNPDGTYLLDSKGNVQYGHCTAIGLCASMRDFAGFQEAMLVLGGQAINPKTGQIAEGPYLNGLFAYFTGQTVSSGPNTEFAKVWANAPVSEKQAAAEAVARSLEAWKGLIVEGTTAAGEQVTGVLKQVLKATPYGAASAAVDAVITVASGTKDQKDVPATITAPFVSRPAGAAAGAAEAGK